jgi:hypothetical protein
VSATGKSRNRWLRISLYAAAGFVLGLGAIAAFLAMRFQPIARQYFISTLNKRYQSEVELGNLNISLFPVVHATGDNLVLWFRGSHDGPPLVEVRRFTLDAAFVSFFREPKHIGQLRLEGLRIHLPPRSGTSITNSSITTPAASHSSTATAAFILDEVIADGATLEITPKDSSKNPLIFEIQKLNLHTVGVGQPMTFHAELNNPKPPGLIHADGKFGPWDASRPVDTPTSGKYTFRDADLSVFKGISGTLASDGEFTGQLDRMEVKGTTETPDFALTIGSHTVPLHTEFQATVDGTNGNTILHPVHARLGHSEFDVSGAVDRGALETRKTILLDATTNTKHPARLEDFLRLSLKGTKPPMTGGIRFNAKVKVPPGDTEVIERLDLDGTFGLDGVKFTSEDVQGKIAGLSHRAQGDPTNHDPNVTADFQGTFHLHQGQLGLPDLRFTLPGVTVSMKGGYGLRSGAISFQGSAKLDAKVSQMTTGFKSKLLRPLDPLFSRDGAGTVIPITIGGTRGQPSFKLDIGQMLRRK